MKRVALAALILASTPATGADFAHGLAAFEAGDFVAAMAEWRQLAEIGDAAAQNNLGFLYEKGLGARADPFAAAEWYQRAAEQGDADAQANLGVLYTLGRGVPKDLVAAHKWLELAAQQGHAKAQADLRKVVRHMTAEEFARARAEARAGGAAEIADAEKSAVAEAPAAAPILPQSAALPVESPSAARGGWQVQIAALSNPDTADAERRRLVAAHPDLQAAAIEIYRADLPRGTFYRIRATGLLSKQAAVTLCNALRARAQDCFVVPRS